jgi:hypothetical protein
MLNHIFTISINASDKKEIEEKWFVGRRKYINLFYENIIIN